MKKFLFLIPAIGCLSFYLLVSFRETLKLTQEEAENGIMDSFNYGAYSGPASETFHAFSVPVRIAMIKEIGAFAKAYTQTEDFSKRYAAHREEYKPLPPESFIPLKDRREIAKADIQNSITHAEASLKNLTGDARKTIEDGLKIMRDQLTQIEDPNNPNFNNPALEKTQKEAYDQEMKEYNEYLENWKNEYPESARELVKKRLTYFLQLSATVDFNAKTKTEEGYKFFVNEDYEGKSYDWKFIYRAGKESTSAARTVATQWLNELK